MEKKLPEFEIEGTLFLVDVFKNELREKDRPENRISFTEMTYQGNHYELEYELTTKNTYGTSLNLNDWKYIKVPQLIDLDPEGMAEKHNLSLREVKASNDYILSVDQTALALRLSGELPTIAIAGDIYVVDQYWSKLTLKDPAEEIRIWFSDLDRVDGKYRGIYDTEKKEIVAIPSDTALRVPDHLIYIEFPTEERLDPVGWINEFHGISLIDLKNTSQTHPLLLQHLMKNPLLTPQPATVLSWELLTVNIDPMEHSQQNDGTVKIDGIEFIVDVTKLELRELNDPANKISFNQMADLGSHYEFTYDREEKKIVTSDAYLCDPQDLQTIQIPQLTELAPEAMAAKYNLEVNQIKGKSDYQIITSLQALQNSNNENRPTIQISETPFYAGMQTEVSGTNTAIKNTPESGQASPAIKNSKSHSIDKPKAKFKKRK